MQVGINLKVMKFVIFTHFLSLFRKTVSHDVEGFMQMINSSSSSDSKQDEWFEKLKTEATRIAHMIQNVELFPSTAAAKESSAALTQRSKNAVDKVTQRLADSLKLELSDSRRVIENQRTRLKDLSREKEELLQTQHWLSEKDGDETIETFDLFDNVISSKRSGMNINTVPICSSQRNIQIAKRMMGNLNENFSCLYDKTSSKCSEITDLHERISYLRDQLKSMTVRTECLEDDFHMLKKNSEQTEINYRSCVDELKTTQNKLRRIEEERNMYLDENMELKNINVQGFYSNMNDESERLSYRFKELESERDGLYDDLQEQIKKSNLCSSECKELEYKRDELEHTITKLKRECIDVTAEMTRVSHENEEIKKSVMDSERQRVNLKRDMKSLETSNKDLEDQLFHLTTENEKNKQDYDKIAASLQGYNSMVHELEEKLTICERDILLIESDLKKERCEKADLEESNKHLRAQLSIKDELEGVLKEARTSMLQQLETKVSSCERGMQQIEKDPVRPHDAKARFSSQNTQVKEIEMILEDAKRKDEEYTIDFDLRIQEQKLKKKESANNTPGSPKRRQVIIPSPTDIFKKEEEIRKRLRNVQEKIDYLFDYIKVRNENLQRGEISPTICKDEYSSIQCPDQQQMQLRRSAEENTFCRITVECPATKNILQKENEYLMYVVSDVRKELLKVQKRYALFEKEVETVTFLKTNGSSHSPRHSSRVNGRKLSDHHSQLSPIEENLFTYSKKELSANQQYPASEYRSAFCKDASYQHEQRHYSASSADQKDDIIAEVDPDRHRCYVIRELEDKLNQCEREKMLFESDLIRERNEKMCLQESYATLDQKLMLKDEEEEGCDEAHPLRLTHEDLLNKMIEQRKEIIKMLGFDSIEQFNDVTLNECLTPNLDYVSPREIECRLNTCSREIDSSYDAIRLFLHTFKHYWGESDLSSSGSSSQMITAGVNPLGIYYSPDELSGESPLTSDSEHSQTSSHRNNRNNRTIQTLVERIKATMMQEENQIESTGIVRNKRKSRNPMRVVRRLKRRLKNKKLLSFNKRYKKLLKSIARKYLKTDDHTDTFSSFHHDSYASIDDDIDLHDLSGTLNDTAEKLREALLSVNSCPAGEIDEELNTSFQSLQQCLPYDLNELSINDTDESSEVMSQGSDIQQQQAPQDQRKYTVERLKFINERFEVLLSCLKERSNNKEDGQNSTTTTAVCAKCNCLKELSTRAGAECNCLKTRAVNEYAKCNCLNELFDGTATTDLTTMNRAVEILKFAKKLQNSDIEELSKGKESLSHEQLKIILVLRKLAERKLKDESYVHVYKNELKDEKHVHVYNSDNLLKKESFLPIVDIRTPGALKLTSGTVRQREKRLRTSLQGTKQRIDDLSGYLKQREDDLEGDNEHVEHLCNELDELEGSHVQKDTICCMKERIVGICEDMKTDLLDENEVLQMIVSEIRSDLLKMETDFNTDNAGTNIQEKESSSNISFADKLDPVRDVEIERSILQSYINSVETGNKDLVDQLLYLTSEHSKTKLEFAKSESLEEYKNMIQELTKVEHRASAASYVDEHASFATPLKKVELGARTERDDGASEEQPKWQLEESQIENNKILSLGYEDLLSRLLNQREETMALFDLNTPGQFQDITALLNFAENIDVKDPSEIEDCLALASDDIDASYNSLAMYLQSLSSDWKRIENYFIELSYFLEKIDSQEKDSCYSTDSYGNHTDAETLETDSNTDSNELTIIENGSPTVESDFATRLNSKNMQKLVNKIKALGKHVTLVDQKLVEMKHKSRRSGKIIRNLQIKLKQRKSLESDNKNRIIHLSRKLKISKFHHNTYHRKRKNTADMFDSTISRDNTSDNNKSEQCNLINTNEPNTQNMIDSTNDSLDILDCSDPLLLNITPNLLTPDPLKPPKVDTDAEALRKTCFVYQEQKVYMIEHLRFTNKRLEHLLACLKDKDKDSCKIEKEKYENEKNSKKETKRIKDIAHNHGEIIVMIMKMNENMERLLKEDRVPNKSNTLTNSNTVEQPKEEERIEKQRGFTPIQKDKFKTDNKLKNIIETTRNKIDDLSEYLKDREDDLKEREEIIAKYNKASEDNNRLSITDAPSEKIFSEYVKTKSMIEDENDFLEIFVTEVREDLENLEKGFKMEEETQMHLSDFADELQISKEGLQQNINQLTTELNEMKREKEYLLQSISFANMMNEYQGPYTSDPSRPSSEDPQLYSPSSDDGCGYCAQNSESSVPPISDEDICPSTASCDDFVSESSEQDIFEIIWTPDATACSKLARNIKTSEATEKIKSKNHPLSNLEKEIKPRDLIRTKSTHAYNSSPCVSSFGSSTLTINKERVLGRRDSVRSGSLGSSNSSFRSNSGMYVNESGSITSQESGDSASSNLQTSLRQKKSYVDITAVDEYTLLEEGNGARHWGNTHISPFLNPKFNKSKKRKKKFTFFGKKW